MPYAKTRDGVSLYYEEAGRGTPVVFVHEFTADLRSWEPQLRFFSRRYRCIAFNARGYPPSDVPRARGKYSQAIVADDIGEVLRHLGLRQAHVVGSAMGGNTVIHFGLRRPRGALSLTAINPGVGADPARAKRAQFLRDIETMAARFETLGVQEALRDHRVGPSRVQFLNKDPRGFAEFGWRYRDLSGSGLANTMRGVHAKRPPVHALERGLRRLRVPLLVVTGDEDDKCLAPGIFIKRACRSAALAIIPWSGHLVNLEEPECFNRLLLQFLTLVDSGRWRPRDPRSLGLSVLSNRG
jgi:pimeloyl-ACP methyl ester carboxylesterase